MVLASLAVGLLFTLFLVHAVSLYWILKRLQRGLDAIRAGFDGLLEQRQDRLSELLELCQNYMPHERTALERMRVVCGALAGMRGQSEPSAREEVEHWLATDLGQLLALARNYRQLQGDRRFDALQGQVLDLQRRIVENRERHMALIERNNRHIARFPASALARVFGFKVLEAESGED